MAAGTIVGLHVHRCGGTSILRMLEAGLPAEALHQSTSLYRNWVTGRPQFPELARPDRLRAVFGHWVHEETLRLVTLRFLFTGLRDPAERLHSHYAFAVAHATRQGHAAPDPREWLAWQGPNPVCHFLLERFPTLGGDSGDAAYERARRVLECFDLVYFPETIEQAAQELGRRLSIAPGLERENSSTAAAPALCLKDIDLEDDRRLHAWARATFEDGPVRAAAGRRQAFLAEPVDRARLARFVFEAERVELGTYGVADRAAREVSEAAAVWRIRQQVYADDALGAPGTRRARRVLGALPVGPLMDRIRTGGR